jgi:putative SOS response-associated peptidase YedK
MCGRYTLSTPSDLLSDLFQLERASALTPRFNIAPTQEAPVVRRDPESGGRRLDLLKWGLVPFWAKDPSIGNRMINARAETVAEKPAYRASFRKRRCLVIADGFYEWKATGGPKQPFFFHRVDGHPFAMAGLWDRWEKAGSSALESFTILTTEANEVVAPVHNRMPVLLEDSASDQWLDSEFQDTGSLARLLVPAPTAVLQATPVTTFVNNPANEGPQCVEPVD